MAFTAEADYNQTLIDAHDSGQVTFGLEVGNYIHAKDYTKVTSPVPMDVPRIRYEIGTRRVGVSPPIADAGPNQLGIAPGTVTLNGSGSYDPLGEALTYQWTQIAGPDGGFVERHRRHHHLHGRRGTDLQLPSDGEEHGQRSGNRFDYGFHHLAGPDADYSVLRQPGVHHRRPEFDADLGDAGRHFG